MEITTATLLYEGAPIVHVSRAAAEGVLAPPVGMNAVGRVLSIGASATASGRTTESGLSCDGSVTLSVVYADPDGGIHGFESTAAFSNEAACPDLPAGAPVTVDPVVSELRHTVTNGTINVRIELSLRYTVLPQCSAAVLSGIEGAGVVELLKRPAALCHTVRADDELTLTEDIHLPQSAAEILSTSAFCRISGVSVSGANASVNGILCAEVLFAGPDGIPAQAAFSLPFEAEAELPEGAESACARCRVISAEAVLTGEDTAELTAVAELWVIAAVKEETELTADAYSSAEKLDCAFLTLALRRDVWADCRATARIELPLPAGMPEAETVHYVRLRPVACGVECADGSVRLSATLHASALYTCAAGLLHSFETTVFCDAQCECPAAKTGMRAEAQLNAELLNASGMPGGIAARLNLTASVTGYLLTEETVLTDAQPAGSRGGSYGPVVYFPTEGESPWEIGRRFGVPQAELLKENPGIEKAVPHAVLVNMRRYI